MKSKCCEADVNGKMELGNLHTFCTKCNEECNCIEETFDELLERKRDKTIPDYVKPDTYWIVVYECRYDIVLISPLGDGFFAFGQDGVWRGDAVTEWIKEVEMPKYDK